MLGRLFSSRKPDPTEHGPFADPLKFGNGYKLARDVVVRTIALNSKTLSSDEIAQRMGLGVETVKRLAREHHIRLDGLPVEKEPDPRGS